MFTLRLADKLNRILGEIDVLARRFHLIPLGGPRSPEITDQQEKVTLEASILRGAWGRALHHLDLVIYHKVFSPPNPSLPLYVIRLAEARQDEHPVFESLYFNSAIDDYAVLRQAWEIALATGLGPDRRKGAAGKGVASSGDTPGAVRQPFRVERYERIGPFGQTEGNGQDLPNDRWSLAAVAEQAALRGLDCEPLRLRFATPFRMLRRKKLIRRPTFADLILAACRRVGDLLPLRVRLEWEELEATLLSIAARTTSLPWQGCRKSASRYSASQKTRLEPWCVLGHLDLPEGAGELAPLLAVATWLHLGKGSTWDLGRLILEPPGEQPLQARPVARRARTVIYAIGAAESFEPNDPLPPVPPIFPGTLVVLEGRAPVWRYAMAVDRLSGTEAGAIAIRTPDLRGAVVAVTHCADYHVGQVIDDSEL